jgi:hypothetical protein
MCEYDKHPVLPINNLPLDQKYNTYIKKNKVKKPSQKTQKIELLQRKKYAQFQIKNKSTKMEFLKK